MYDAVSAVAISAPHAEQASSLSAVVKLLWDAATFILCLLIQISAQKSLDGCFGDVRMKAETDIKEGIQQAPLCCYSTGWMTCLDLAVCISVCFNMMETAW